jgi:hypothetical protein
VWQEYYTPAFLAHPSTVRFWRLPNIQDLTDTSKQLGGVGQRITSTGHFTKLPRWAYTVTHTHYRQPTLPKATVKELALTTLQDTISRQRKDCPDIQPYSETQTRFWLNKMRFESIDVRPHETFWLLKNLFGCRVASGSYDLHEWEAYYSRERWESTEAQVKAVEPDRDGTWKSDILWCDIARGGEASMIGWAEELGGEEEIKFLAAVAAKEIEALPKGEAGTSAEEMADAVNGDTATGLNYAIRSHMILGVLRAAFETKTYRARHLDDLKRQITSACRLDDEAVTPWVEQVLEVVEPYAKRTRPTDIPSWSRLLQLILEENGQLFGRWKQMGEPKNPFRLGPRRDLLSES